MTAKETLDLIQKLFDGASSLDGLRAFCRAMREFASADAVGVRLADISRGKPIVTMTCGAAPLTAAAYKAYDEHWVMQDPHVRVALRGTLPYGALYLCHDHYPPEARQENAYFRDFLAPHGIAWTAGYMAQLGDGLAIGLLIVRGPERAPFEDTLKQRLYPVAGVLGAAGAAILESERRAAALRAALQALAITTPAAMCLDQRGRVVWASDMARGLCRDQAPLVLTGDRLTSENAAAIAALENAAGEMCLSPTAKGRDFSFQSPDAPSKHMRARLAPDCTRGLVAPDHGLRTVLLALDPDMRPSTSSVKLAPREFEIAGYIANGASAPEIAGALGLKELTIRTVFKRLYKKFEVKNQRQLTALLLREPPWRKIKLQG
jgi:DNA-binding CsgD family transcriptional regulator